MKPLHVLGMLALAYVAGICTAPQSNADVEGMKAQITPLLAVNDSLTLRISDLAYERDSMIVQFSADSAAWQAERDALSARSRIARAEADSIAAELRAIGDSAVVRLTADLEIAHADEVGIWVQLADGYEAERDALLEQRAQLLALTSELQQKTRVQAQIIDHQQAVNRAIASQQHTFRDEIGRYALGALIGAVVWEMAR